MITLKNIDWNNFNEIIKLNVRVDQQAFVAPVLYSLAQSYVAITNNDTPPLSFAIYNNEDLIGHTLIMYYHANNIYGSDESYVINRFLIDKEYQGRGYGRKAFEHIIAYIKTFPQGKTDSIYLSCNSMNEVAKNLYFSCGFIDTFRILQNGELVLKLDLREKNIQH